MSSECPQDIHRCSKTHMLGSGAVRHLAFKAGVIRACATPHSSDESASSQLMRNLTKEGVDVLMCVPSREHGNGYALHKGLQDQPSQKAKDILTPIICQMREGRCARQLRGASGQGE